MQTAKKTYSRGLMLLIVAGSLAFVSCAYKGSPARKSEQAEAKPRQTPVAFQATKENGGKRCEPLWYTGQPGDEHDSADHHCFVLQEKLINGALDGNLNHIREARYEKH